MELDDSVDDEQLEEERQDDEQLDDSPSEGLTLRGMHRLIAAQIESLAMVKSTIWASHEVNHPVFKDCLDECNKLWQIANQAWHLNNFECRFARAFPDRLKSFGGISRSSYHQAAHWHCYDFLQLANSNEENEDIDFGSACEEYSRFFESYQISEIREWLKIEYGEALLKDRSELNAVTEFAAIETISSPRILKTQQLNNADSSLEAPNDSLDDYIEKCAASLTNQGRKILFSLLTKRQTVSFSNIRNAIGSEISDSGIETALKRIRDTLPRDQWSFKISMATTSVSWVKRPELKVSKKGHIDA